MILNISDGFFELRVAALEQYLARQPDFDVGRDAATFDEIALWAPWFTGNVKQERARREQRRVRIEIAALTRFADDDRAANLLQSGGELLARRTARHIYEDDDRAGVRILLRLDAIVFNPMA